MSFTEIKGKAVMLDQPAMLLFNAFSDLRNFAMAIPPDKKEGLTITADSIEGTVNGMNVGVKIANKVPFSSISFEPYGQLPFECAFTIYLKDIAPQKTEFQIVLNAELNYMVKLMIGGKLQGVEDTITDQIAAAFSGKAPSREEIERMMKERGGSMFS